MTDKTESEVMTELKAAVDLINNGCRGLDSLEITKDHCIDQLWVKDRRGVVLGNAHPYAPDPDTKEVALDKAYSMFKSLSDKGEQPNICNVEDDKIGYYFTVSPCDSGGIFDYAKPSTDQITDEAQPDAPKWWMEAPPKGAPVVGEHGRYYLSVGGFDSIGRLDVINTKGVQCYIPTYKSLITPHRSEHWED